MRAMEVNFDTVLQFRSRMMTLEKNGHKPDKAEIIVLGETFGDWKALDFASNSVVMYLNGEFVEDAVTGDAMGHPFNSITWLADLLARQGKELKAGDIVLTGSTLATHFPEPGDKYLYEVKGLGSVSAEIY